MSYFLAVCLFLVYASVSQCEEIFSDSLKLEKWPSVEGMQADKKGGEMLEALMDREEEFCYGKRCSRSEECCKGSACVDMAGLSGICLPIYGNVYYQPCFEDSDCSNGLVCANYDNSKPSKTCQMESWSIEKKGFNEECVSSSDCNVKKGMCCQLLRRQRLGPKKQCLYFTDPMNCIGPMETSMKQAHTIQNSFFKARQG